MGKVIGDDHYGVDYNTTLGEIFVDDTAWEQITDHEEMDFKKNSSLWELFTFESGLSIGVTILDPFPDSRKSNTWDRVGKKCESNGRYFHTSCIKNQWFHTVI